MLALAIAACNRDRMDQASELNTTSAELEKVDRSGVAVPMGPAVKAVEPEPGPVAADPNQVPIDLGEIDTPDGKPLATPDMSSVGPGHIWYVPGGDTTKAKRSAPGTGEPNSSGSHNIGSGALTP